MKTGIAVTLSLENTSPKLPGTGVYSRGDSSFFVMLTKRFFGIPSHSYGSLLECPFLSSNNLYLFTSYLLPRAIAVMILLLEGSQLAPESRDVCV